MSSIFDIPAKGTTATPVVSDYGTGVMAPTVGAWEDAVGFTLKHEGGLNPRDTNGTPSNFGMNQAANPDINVLDLTPETAKARYRTKYWDTIGGDDLAKVNPHLAKVAFDTSVLAGPGRAKEFLTLAGQDPQKFMDLREGFLQRLLQKDPAKYGPYEKAWANRNRELRGGGDNVVSTPSVAKDSGIDLSSLMEQYGTDPYPKKEPSVVGEALSEYGTLVKDSVNKAFVEPFKNTLHLNPLADYKPRDLGYSAMDVAKGIPEFTGTLASGLAAFPMGQVAGLSEVGNSLSNPTKALSKADKVASEVMEDTMYMPKSVTGQLLNKLIEIPLGTLTGSIAESVKAFNPEATEEELKDKISASRYVLNWMLLGAPMLAKALSPKEVVRTEWPELEKGYKAGTVAKELGDYDVKIEDVEAVKEQVKADPNTPPEVKAQVDSVPSETIADTITNKIKQAQAADRVAKSSKTPTAKFEDNQRIVNGLLVEADLRRGDDGGAFTKAAKIVAGLEQDAALVDFNPVKGIRVDGPTGKAIARLVAERDALKKSEERVAAGTGEDVPLEPVTEITPEVPISEPMPEPVVDPIQSMAHSVDLDIRYIDSKPGIPGVIDDQNIFSTKIPGSDKETSFNVNGEVTAEKIRDARDKILEGYKPKEEVPTVEPKVEETKDGKVQGKEEEIVIPEFDNTKLARGEGYTFPTKQTFKTPEEAQTKANLIDGAEVVKVKDHYRVAKFKERPDVAEYATEAELNQAGWEMMSEVPADKVAFESPSKGFGIAKVGDKYYRVAEKVEMPRVKSIIEMDIPEGVGDGVSVADRKALLQFADEATLRELEAQDRVRELTSTLKAEKREGKVVDPTREAELVEAYQKWKDSYVTKSYAAIQKTSKGKPKKKPTKESMAIVDDNFKEFESREAAEEWMAENGKTGHITDPDPLTGKVSYIKEDIFKTLDEVDMWDEGVEQLTGRRENYSDGMLSSDDLYNKQSNVSSIWGYPFKGEKEFKTGRQFYREVFPVYKLGGEKTSGVKTIGEALEILIKHSDDSIEKRIVEKIYSVIDKDIPIKFEDNGLGKLGLRGKDILGMYSQWESGNPRGFIALATEDSSILSYTPSIGTLARTIVHESTHAVLSNALRKGMDERETSTYSNEAIFAAKIDRAYIKAKEVLKDKYPKEYGLSSRNEFLAEALSNNKFQDLLKEVKMYNGTVWGKLVESVRKFLGFSKEESNAFFKVLDATDKYIDTISPSMELSDTGKMDLFSILNNERGAVDVTALYSSVEKIQSIVRAAEKLGKTIDEYLASFGADEAAIAAFNAMVAQVPQMKQQIKEADPVTSAILMPEGKVVAQRVNKTKDGKIRSVGPPITEDLATRVMNADRTKQWGTDIVRKDPETGRIRVEHTSNAFEVAMRDTEVKINSFRAAGLSDLYAQWREALKNSQEEKAKIKQWIKDDLRAKIPKEEMTDFTINTYIDHKGGKEAFAAMGLDTNVELPTHHAEVLDKYFRFTESILDRSNLVRTHTGQKAIPKLYDLKGRPNYAPMMRALNVLRDLGVIEGLTISDVGKLGELSKNFNGMFNPHSKKRNVSDIPIELDPFTALERFVDYTIDEIHLSPIAALAKDLANVKLPRVDQPKGKISLSEWNPYLSQMLSRWSDQILGKDPVSTAMSNTNPLFSLAKDRLSKNLVVATIGGSLRTVLVQPTSYMIGVPTMLDMRSTGYGLWRLLSDRTDAKKNSSVLAIREADYAFSELAEYIKQGKISGTKAYLAEKSLAPMKWVDSVMAEASWNAAKYYGEKRLNLQGKELYRFADDVVERTQGLGIRGAVSNVQSSAAMKWLTLLQTFAIADFNLIARDVLGIKNPELNQTQTIKRVAKYVGATILAGQMYKMIGMENVVPDPIGAYQQAKEDNKGNLRAIGAAAGELLEKVPLIGGSAKFGSNLFGIAGEWGNVLPEAGEKFAASLDWDKLTDKQKSYNIRLIARAVGLTAGIPMTNQILKSVNSAYKGGNPWQIILGVYDKEKKRKSLRPGDLRPSIPRPRL
jgi:hypothetical protein